MKQMDPKNQSEFMASQQLKKIIPQLLLSVSLFSFVFSYSSLYSPSSLVYSPKFPYYFSGNSFDQLLSHALNKNCLFLICNGLLVFLAKTSGFIQPPSGRDLNDVLQKRIDDSLQTVIEKYVMEEVAYETKEEEKDKSDSPKDQVSIFIAESEEEGDQACNMEDQKEKEENLPDSRRYWLFDDDEQQLYGEEVEEEDDEHEGEEEEEREEMSTEELNQKFEDFIRKMKEDIIINEARQKVVMVK